jgi:hypothetical protein
MSRSCPLIYSAADEGLLPNNSAVDEGLFLIGKVNRMDPYELLHLFIQTLSNKAF